MSTRSKTAMNLRTKPSSYILLMTWLWQVSTLRTCSQTYRFVKPLTLPWTPYSVSVTTSEASHVSCFEPCWSYRSQTPSSSLMKSSTSRLMAWAWAYLLVLRSQTFSFAFMKGTGSLPAHLTFDLSCTKGT